jgi:protein-arginine kinase activator protein McsA
MIAIKENENRCAACYENEGQHKIFKVTSEKTIERVLLCTSCMQLVDESTFESKDDGNE